MSNIEKLLTRKEDLYFDFKSSNITADKLAETVIGMANANGGEILVGIDDKTKTVDGFDNTHFHKINELQRTLYDFTRGDIKISYENIEFEEMTLFLLNVAASTKLISKSNGDVFLRQGDSTKKLTREQVKSLEYERN